MFNFFPPLIFIYLIPGILSNTHVIPLKDPTYDWMKINLLPIFLVLLMLDVDIRAAIKVMGRGVMVMLARYRRRSDRCAHRLCNRKRMA